MTPAARVERSAYPADAAAVEGWLRVEGLTPARWGAGPGHRFALHHHPHTKVVVCVAGGIVFHLPSGDEVPLGPGDRFELAAGVAHRATVGEDGVECVEAPRP